VRVAEVPIQIAIDRSSINVIDLGQRLGILFAGPL
jgi:hypothetical protein